MRRETVLAALAALVLGVAGCPKQDDDFTPQIHVTPGAAARVLWIDSHRPKAREAAAESEGPSEDAGLTVSAEEGQGDAGNPR